MAHCIVPEAEKLLDKEIRVLDHGFVRLVDYLGGDARIVQTARVSYGKGTRTSREDAALIDYLMRHQHTSPFEHVVLELHCKLPIFVARQWIRHRTARLNEISGRYSIMEQEFYLPPDDQIKRQSKDNKQGREEEVPDEVRTRVLELLKRDQGNAYAAYEEMLNDGVARELARINLPLSLYTQWYWQMDLHNLFHFLALRMDPHAQWEIRVYADAIYTIAKAVAPMACKSFERHVLKGRRFSAEELDALRKMLKGEPNPLTSRRLKEFEWKIGATAGTGTIPPTEPAPGKPDPSAAAQPAVAEREREKPGTPEAPDLGISRDEINHLPLTRYEGPITVVRDERTLKEAIRKLKKEKVLGFDTETRPSFRKGESYPPALIQLAGEHGVYLFQLRFLPDLAPLFGLLSDPSSLKAGVALEHDIRKLRELAPLEPGGMLDLAEASSKAGIRNNGLRGLAALLLGVRISKGAQRSNWGRDPLSPAQENYAATDAWISREIYLELKKRGLLD